MRKLNLILLGVTVLFSIPIESIALQNKSIQEPPPPPPLAIDYSPDRWKEYTSSEGNYRVRFPGIPQQLSRTEETEMGRVPVQVATYRSFIMYSVVYMDYPQAIDDPSLVSKVFDAIRDNLLSKASTVHPRVIVDSNISFEGHSGRFLQLELGSKTVARIKLVAVKNRLYYLSVITQKEQGGLESERGYEKIAMAFLNSFHLL